MERFKLDQLEKSEIDVENAIEFYWSDGAVGFFGRVGACVYVQTHGKVVCFFFYFYALFVVDRYLMCSL